MKIIHTIEFQIVALLSMYACECVRIWRNEHVCVTKCERVCVCVCIWFIHFIFSSSSFALHEYGLCLPMLKNSSGKFFVIHSLSLSVVLFVFYFAFLNWNCSIFQSMYIDCHASKSNFLLGPFFSSLCLSAAAFVIFFGYTSLFTFLHEFLAFIETFERLKEIFRHFFECDMTWWW